MTKDEAMEKARSIVRKYYGQLGAMEDEIASALLAARDGAIEECAKKSDKEAENCEAEFAKSESPAQRNGWLLCVCTAKVISKDIRELKGT